MASLPERRDPVSPVQEGNKVLRPKLSQFSADVCAGFGPQWSPESVAMKITGHKTNAMFKRYNITDTADVRRAMLSVSAYRESQQQRVVVMAGAQRRS